MIAEIDESLHWTEHFARYGFAVRKGLASRAFCEEATQRARELVGNDLPLEEWSTQNTEVLHRAFYEGATPLEPILEKIFEQPRLRADIAELFGGEGEWNQERNFYLFLRPFNPDAEPKLAARGHIDFTTQPVPALYRGFMFQVALVDTEPFSGNLTVYPGTHIPIQKELMDGNPQYKGGSVEVEMPAPFEFVAEAGDVIFLHHLLAHSGNESHSINHLPRIGLHCEVFRDEWLRSIDPAEVNLSPWQKSLAHNGAWEEKADVEESQMKKREDYLETLRAGSTPEAGI